MLISTFLTVLILMVSSEVSMRKPSLSPILSVITDAKSAHIGENYPGDDVRNRAGRTQWNQDANEDWDALESRRIRARQIGEDDDDDEEKDEKLHQLIGGICPLGIEVLEMDVSFLYFVEEIA